MRHGAPYCLLRTMFDYSALDGMNDLFWHIASIHLAKCNPIPQLFNEREFELDKVAMLLFCNESISL